MAVVTSAFTTIANQVWASPTWSADDPSYKLNTQLTNWITAINDPAKIEMIHNPGNATSRSSSSGVRWLLRARDGDTANGDYGLIFCNRIAGASSGAPSPYSGCYFGRTDSSSNNGAGTFAGNIDNSSGDNGWNLEVARSHFVAYEATGSLPWFVYGTKRSASGGSGFMQAILRLDTSAMAAGSYYPSSGLAKWLLLTTYDENSSYAMCFTPQARSTTPAIGVQPTSSTDNWAFGTGPSFAAPKSGRGDGYFFRLSGIFGDTHYLGQPTQDILLSSAATAAWGDTVTFSGVTYTNLECAGVGFWVRTS